MSSTKSMCLDFIAVCNLTCDSIHDTIQLVNATLLQYICYKSKVN